MPDPNPLRQARFALSAPSWQALPPADRPEVAFLGRSNVGKSSLLNALCERKQLALTSATPGKTRAFNFFDVDGRFWLVDIPGYGFAKVSKKERAHWAALIERYAIERPSLRLILHLIDSRHAPTALDREVFAALKGSDVPSVIVLTKSDKLGTNARDKSVREAHAALTEVGREAAVVLTSAQTGRGLDDVRRWIDETVAAALREGEGG